MASLKVFPPCVWLLGDWTMFFVLPGLLFLWASFFPKVSFKKPTIRYISSEYNNTQIEVDQSNIFYEYD